MNYIETWLRLIRTPARARALRKRLDDLKVTEFGVLDCPSKILYGERGAARLYADATVRPALDAWDTGLLTKQDLLTLCLALERGAVSVDA